MERLKLGQLRIDSKANDRMIETDDDAEHKSKSTANIKHPKLKLEEF